MDSHEVQRIVTQLQELNKTATEILKKLDFLAGEKVKISSTSTIRPQEAENKPEP